MYFHDEPKATKQIIFSVKAGSLHANYVRDLRGVIEREKAAIGVLITMEQPVVAVFFAVKFNLKLCSGINF